jgi:hypothetical protein
MSKVTIITERALELLGQAGDSMKHVGPSATKLLQTGAALGAVKTGSKLAVGLVRRNPVVAVAAALGVGVMAYAAKRKRDKDGSAPIEGRSKRVEAKRVTGTAKRTAAKSTATKTAARKPRARKTTSTAASE